MISKIQISHFRNIVAASLCFSDGINLFCGLNGSGKTNLLEAIGLFALGKSCRSAKETEMVRFGEDLTEVIGTIESEKKKSKSR